MIILKLKMLQLQYYNSILKNNQITKILDNYKLKYSLVVNEIESKVNELMKLCLKDILVFLENIGEVSEQKHKINEYNKNRRELEQARLKLKNKAYIENKLKNEIDLLQQENNFLKLKINSLNEKLYNQYNFNSCTSQTVSPVKTTSTMKVRSRNILSMPKRNNATITPKDSKQNNLTIVLNNSTIIKEDDDIKTSKSLIISKSPKKKFRKNIQKVKNVKENNNKKEKTELKLSCEKINKNKNINNKNNNNNNINNININNNNNKFTSQKKKDNTNKFVKFVNNNKSITTKNLVINIDNNKLTKSFEKRNKNYPKSGIINNKLNLNKKYKRINISIDSRNTNDVDFKNYNNRYSPLNTFNQSIELPLTNLNVDYDDIGKKINTAIDEELKELEKDEANIELLLDQLIDENDEIEQNDN